MILQLCIVYIEPLQPIFKTTALSTDAMELVLIATAAGILGLELIKMAMKWGKGEK